MHQWQKFNIYVLHTKAFQNFFSPRSSIPTWVTSCFAFQDRQDRKKLNFLVTCVGQLSRWDSFSLPFANMISAWLGDLRITSLLSPPTGSCQAGQPDYCYHLWVRQLAVSLQGDSPILKAMYISLYLPFTNMSTVAPRVSSANTSVLSSYSS